MGFDLGGALQGAATQGIDAIDKRQKEIVREAAEVRAANLNLDVSLRLEAGKELLKNRAAERFGTSVKNKMGTQVPMEADPVTETTAESGKAIGLQEGLTGDVAKQRELLSRIPDAAQRAEAMAQLDKQEAAQGLIHSNRAAGKTRPVTREEAIKAAQEENLLNDPAAFKAGKELTAPDKTDIEERKLASREKLEQMRIDQKDRGDDKKFDMLLTRIEAGFGGGKGSQPTALMQNAEYLKSLGYTPDKIEKFIFEKKETSTEDLAAKILSADKYGEMTPEQAAQKAMALRNSLDNLTGKSPAPGEKPAGAKMDALPPGAKQVGTSGGKPVYEVNGKRFIQK